MRGRSGCPTGQEKKGVGAIGRSFYKERLGTGSPPHQSPSVTASPQGEASGLCCPTRKSVPNQGTYMGAVIAPPPKQCGTTAKTSECQRAGHKNGGAGGYPRDSLRPGFLLEKAWIPRPGPGGNPPRRAHPAMVLTGPPADGRPLNSPAIIPESRPDDNQRERLACRKQARPAVSGLLEKCILEISIGSALCYPGDSSPGGIFLGPIA